MMNRHFLSAAVGLALSAGAGFAIAQGASAPRMEKAMQAAQSIRDAQPSATTTPPTTTPAARTAQVAETSVRPTQAAPSPQASIPVAAAPSPKTEAAQAGAEADELSILQRQAAVLKVKAEIAKYQADIKSSESRAMQAATSVTPGQAGEPGVVPSLVVPGNVTKPPIPLPAAKHGKPRLVHIGGADGVYSALIEITGITISDAVAGTQLGDGWQVIGVDAKQVRVGRGKQVLKLAV